MEGCKAEKRERGEMGMNNSLIIVFPLFRFPIFPSLTPFCQPSKCSLQSCFENRSSLMFSPCPPCLRVECLRPVPRPRAHGEHAFVHGRARDRAGRAIQHEPDRRDDRVRASRSAGRRRNRQAGLNITFPLVNLREIAARSVPERCHEKGLNHIIRT